MHVKEIIGYRDILESNMGEIHIYELQFKTGKENMPNIVSLTCISMSFENYAIQKKPSVFKTSPESGKRL